MTRPGRTLWLAAIAIVAACGILARADWQSAGRDDNASSPARSAIGGRQPGGPQSVLHSYGRLALSFEANQGQADSRVKFISRGSGYGLFLTQNETVLALTSPRVKPRKAAELSMATDRPTKGAVLRMKLLGASPEAQVSGVEELLGKSNYFIGSDPQKWRTDLPTYARVKYSQIYPGVDLLYYGNQRELESDFIVAAGGKPGVIALGVEGAKAVSLDTRGNLVMQTTDGEVCLEKPVAYQESNGVRSGVAARYRLDGRRVGFTLGEYDQTKPLVIDPVLVYSTYLGGTALINANGIAVDSGGNAYVTGSVSFGSFTTTGAFQTSLNGQSNALVTKLNADGSAVIYSTYIGGGASDGGTGIAVDSAGSAYVVGTTTSTNFPTTSGAFQTSLNGSGNAFVTKLNATGSALVYSTYIGGSSSDGGTGVAVDSAGSAYIAGSTTSTNFPTTSGAFQPSLSGGEDVFVSKLNPAGSALVYSSFLGGTAQDTAGAIAVDSSGSAYVTGFTFSDDFPTTSGAFQTTFQTTAPNENGFVTKVNGTGTALVYSTYLGGDYSEQALGIAVDSAGSAYVAGFTESANFPTTPGAFQTTLAGTDNGFVTKLNPNGSGLIYSTYLGGNGVDQAFALAVDSTGSAHVTGQASSSNFPTTSGAFQTTIGGAPDAFEAQLSADGSTLLYSTYLGGGGYDIGLAIAVDSVGSAYLTGFASAGFPTTPGAVQASGTSGPFVAKVGIPSPATHFEVSAPASATAGTPFSFTVTALDSSNNTVVSYTGTVQFTSSDAAAVLSSTYTFTAADSGVHVFSATLMTPGSQTITATDTVNGFQGTSNAITVTSPATHFAVSAPASVNAGTAFSFTVTPLDSSNNVVTNYTGTVNFTSTDPQALLPASYTFTAGTVTQTFSATLKTPGNQTITVTDASNASLSGASGTITVVTPDFSLTATSPISVNVDGSGISTVTAGALNGFSSAVGLSVSAAPSGVSASLSPTSVTPSGGKASSTLTVSLEPSVTPTAFTLNITGTSSALTHSVPVDVNVSVTSSSIANVIASLAAAGCIDSAGLADVLTIKLWVAQVFIAAGDPRIAINVLGALLYQIDAQAGKHILASCTIGGQTFNPATVLAVDVQSLIDSLRVGTVPNPITGYVVNSSNLGISGATVRILDGTTTVATATTDVTGFYYFPTTSVLSTNTSYAIEVSPIPSPFTTSTPPASTFTWTGSGLTFTFTLN